VSPIVPIIIFKQENIFTFTICRFRIGLFCHFYGYSLSRPLQTLDADIHFWCAHFRHSTQTYIETRCVYFHVFAFQICMAKAQKGTAIESLLSFYWTILTWFYGHPLTNVDLRLLTDISCLLRCLRNLPVEKGDVVPNG
jgi:hypothetical protein